MRIKHLKGNLCSEGQETEVEKWLALWLISIAKAKKEKSALIVLQIPEGLDWLKIGGEFDKIIQDKLKS